MAPVDGTTRATAIGFTAVLMWAPLALLVTFTGRVPPFLLVALCFTLASAIAATKWLINRENPGKYLRHPIRVWFVGVGGLFGYHFFYFIAIKNAPPVEAALIAYLSPLLIVLFSALLPGEKLRWYHVVGVSIGLAGTAVLMTAGNDGFTFKTMYAYGYGAAFVCALTWASYSLASRRLGHVPTDSVGGFCAVTAILAFLAHLVLEPAIWPSGAVEWFAVVLLGLGPVGLAFFTWDHGVKRGNIQALGGSFYAAPLLAAALLILFGRAEPTWQVGLACVLIVGGALVASRDLFRRS